MTKSNLKVLIEYIISEVDDELSNSQKLNRECPDCHKPLTYQCKSQRDNAEKKGSVCADCKYKRQVKEKPTDLTRECPSCKTKLIYKNYYNWLDANKFGQVCSACATKERVGMKYTRRVADKTVGFKSKNNFK